MNIADFYKSNIPIENREEELFKLIDSLDKESFNLFSEIIDLSDNSSYKLEKLVHRIEKLRSLFASAKSSYEYINNVESSNYDYAIKRFQLRKLLISIASLYLIIINVFIGIFGCIVLSMRAANKYKKELEATNSKIVNFDDGKMILINNTLDNCDTLLKGKFNKIKERNLSQNDIFANYYIADYIEGNLPKEAIASLGDNTIKSMINILQKDLNTEINDIYELLNMAREKEIKSLKLIKEYNMER